MRFSTPNQVIEYCDRAAINDYKMHVDHGTDLNPFSTEGARNQWQRGFDGAAPYSFETTLDYDTIYQRGKSMFNIISKV